MVGTVKNTGAVISAPNNNENQTSSLITENPDDDVSSEYIERREKSAGFSAAAELDAAFGVSSGTHNDDVSNEYVSRRHNAAGVAAEDRLRARYATSGDEKRTPTQEATQQPIGAVSIAKDVGEGIIETPLQAIGGIADAVNETSDLIFEISQWMNEHVADLGNVSIGKDGIKFTKGTPKENALKIPTTDEADSTTGGIVRNVSQFVTGFVGAGKLLKPFKALQSTGRVTQAATKGAIADFTVFDPHEERLSNLVQEVPALQNPVNEFLAASPSDSAAEGRFKNAVEGLGLGVITDGFLLGLKTLRNARLLKEVAEVSATQTPRATANDFTIIGDIDSSDLVLKKVKAADNVVTSGPKDATTNIDETIKINFARIETPDDIKRVMQETADAFKTDINDSARGKRTHEQTILSAQQENAWSILMERRVGQPLNAEQSLAARQLWVSSSEKLTEVAKLADKNPSESNLFMFRKMLSIHHAVQKEVIAARTETARALNAWRIPAGSTVDLSRQIDDMVNDAGGADVARELAGRVAALSESGMVKELNEFVNQGVFARTRGAIAQAWINGLLSNPTTHVVNAMSNWSVIFQQMYERKAASYISDILGNSNGVAAKEATAQLFGMVEGIKDALRVSAKGRAAAKTATNSLIRGDVTGAKGILAENADEFGGVYRSGATGKTGFGLNKVELPRQGALSAETWNIASDTWLGRSLDFIDAATRTPGHLLGVSDEFFKSIGYRMELHAQAVRKATSELNAGALTPDELKARIADIVANPPPNIKLEAIDAATYQTFTKNTDWLPKQIADKIGKIPVLGKILLPFKRTPINILSYAFERTPFAPVVKEWRADITAGGARRDLALARMSTGTAVLLAAVDISMSGTITGQGPTQAGERANFMRQGKQPYSVKVGDKWYSYSRLDPLGMTLGLAADMHEIALNSQELDEETEKAFQAAMLAVAKNVTSKTYLQGIASFFDAVSDPDRYGESYFKKLAGSVVPAGIAAATRIEDPYMRAAQSSVDAIKARLPMWSNDLAPYRDLWGRTISYQSGFGAAYDAVSPIYVKAENPEPIDAELDRLGYFPQNADRKTSFNGVLVDLGRIPHVYSRYVELAGNELKHPAWNLGAKDFLNQVISGNHPMSQVYWYGDESADGPDGRRAMFIRSTLEEFRSMAKDKLLRESDELRAIYDINRTNNSGKSKGQKAAPLTLR